MSTPFYVSPEQLMKDRADFARKGIARGRSVVVIQYADGILFVSENPSQALHKVSRDLRPDRVRRGRSLQRVREPAHRRRPPRRHARLRLRPPRRHRPRAGQRLRPDARQHLLLAAARSPTRWRSSSPRWATRPPTTRSTASPTTARWPTSTASPSWVAPPTWSPATSRSTTPRAPPSRTRCTPRRGRPRATARATTG